MRHLQKALLLTVILGSSYLPACSQHQDTKAWQEFTSQSPDNVLLDFSYAGYDHGLTVPPNINTLNYKVYEITDPQFGAIANDNVSDKAALLKVIAQIKKDIKNDLANANAIILFPEGEFILHGPEDDETDPQTGKLSSPTIPITLGHVILKGAGRGKTILKMTAPMQPKDEKLLYSSPHMLSIKHNGKKAQDIICYTNITVPAKKNDMSVTVQDVSLLKKGQWVWVQMASTEDEAIANEMKPYAVNSTMKNMLGGVVVDSYHQIKSIDGNKVTFEEPIMHDIDTKYNWALFEYPHYEGVGIEDLTFEGQATEYFCHHKTWNDDGGYKPILLMRMTNSWIRRVDFRSISECITVESSANVSCYDIEISGNRGHSAVRMANSSRGFIGNVYDHSDGYLHKDASVGKFTDRKLGLGQYHACGISKHSLGNVIWNCQWGDDACFESHATQPRASLFDCCKGGFMQLRMGGALDQLPNHLDDLTIWNFECTVTNKSEFPFKWWDDDPHKWYKTLPPTVIGFHGTEVVFEDSQMKRNENQNEIVTPYSLYEAQLKHRLGYVPEWLTELKGNGKTIPSRPGRTWDFTALSSTDEALLKADTQEWMPETSTDGNTHFYSNLKEWGSAADNVELKDVRSHTGKMTADGQDLECAVGLRFGIFDGANCKVLGKGKMRVCTDKGRKSLQLNANNIAIVIPDCTQGQQIIVHSKTTTSAQKRYLKSYNLDVIDGFDEPENTNIIQESRGTVSADGDVILTTVNGNFLYDIIIKDAKGNIVPTGITDISHSPKKVSSAATYNLAGQRVSTFYKGIVIRNGRKYIQR